MTTDPEPILGRRRRRLSEDQRRDQIVRATVATVADLGYEGATLARIADRAGVSKGLVSHHFADKDDLMAQTVTITVRRLREEIAAELELTAPVPEVIRAAIRRAAQLHTTHRCELSALRRIVPALRASPDGERLSLADYEETYQAQRRLFERGQAEGTLRSLDPTVMAVTYQGAIDTMLAYADAYPDVDLEHYSEVLADIVLGGFQVPGAPPPARRT